MLAVWSRQAGVLDWSMLWFFLLVRRVSCSVWGWTCDAYWWESSLDGVNWTSLLVSSMSGNQNSFWEQDNLSMDGGCWRSMGHHVTLPDIWSILSRWSVRRSPPSCFIKEKKYVLFSGRWSVYQIEHSVVSTFYLEIFSACWSMEGIYKN